MPIVKVTTTIAQSGIEKLLKNARLFSYTMASFTKTYLVIEGSEAKFYFRGNKSLMTLGVELTQPVITPVFLTLDISKFISAAKKVAGTNAVNLTLTNSPPSLRLSSDTSNDKITLSVQMFEPDSSEVAPLLEFFAAKEPLFDKGFEINATPEFNDFMAITSDFMSAVTNKNNSIAVFNDRLVYADRTVVVSAQSEALRTPSSTPVKIHKFVLGFFELVQANTPQLLIDPSNNFALWKSATDPSFKAVLAIDPCVLAIPEPDDIAQIVPEDSKYQTLVLKAPRLTEAIDFFSGLFEASAWKPVTFLWTSQGPDQAVKLSYQHPSTEVEKDLVVEEFEGNLTDYTTTAAFTLISDSLRTLLSRMSGDGEVRLTFNDEASDAEHGAGVSMTYTTPTGVKLYSVVLAKLAEV
jgi:hypothetical protein